MASEPHPAHLPPPPPYITDSARAYYAQLERDLMFMNFIVNTVLASDYMPYQLERLLDGKDPDEVSPAQLARTNPGGRTLFFRGHSQVFLETVISRFVDNFQKYLADLLGRCSEPSQQFWQPHKKS
jgi:hypothetical protein